MDALSFITQVLGFERKVPTGKQPRPDFVDTTVTVYTRAPDEEPASTEWWPEMTGGEGGIRTHGTLRYA